MASIIVKLLQGLAAQLDKWMPGKGVRHIVVAVLVIVGNTALYLTGHVTADAAASNIATAIGIIFAARHTAPPQ